MEDLNLFTKLFRSFGNWHLNSDECHDDFEVQEEKDCEQDRINIFKDSFNNDISSQSQWMNEMFNKMFTPAFGTFEPFMTDPNFSLEVNPRDYMLKDAEEGHALIDENYKLCPPPEVHDNLAATDSDIDDKVAKEGLFSPVSSHSQPSSSNIIFKQSVSRIIHKPDGTIEEYRTYKDSSGKNITEFTHSLAGEQNVDKSLNDNGDHLFSFDKDVFFDFNQTFRNFEDHVRQITGTPIQQESMKENITGAAGDPNYSKLFKKFFNLYTNEDEK